MRPFYQTAAPAGEPIETAPRCKTGTAQRVKRLELRGVRCQLVTTCGRLLRPPAPPSLISSQLY